MKYCIRLTNEKGKEIKLAGNEYIDIDVFDGNNRIASYTLGTGENPDTGNNTPVITDRSSDELIFWADDK